MQGGGRSTGRRIWSRFTGMPAHAVRPKTSAAYSLSASRSRKHRDTSPAAALPLAATMIPEVAKSRLWQSHAVPSGVHVAGCDGVPVACSAVKPCGNAGWYRLEEASALVAHWLSSQLGGGGGSALWLAHCVWQSVASEKRGHSKYLEVGPPSSHSPSLRNSVVGQRSPHSCSTMMVAPRLQASQGASQSQSHGALMHPKPDPRWASRPSCLPSLTCLRGCKSSVRP